MKTTWMVTVVACLAATPAWSGPTSLWIKSVDYLCGTALDDTIRVDIMLNSINDPIDNAGLGIYWLTDSVSFVRADRGALTAGWSSWVTSDDPGPTPSMRQINIVASNVTPIPAGISGQFATLVFVQKYCVTAPAQGGSNTNTLCVAQAYNDFLHIDTYCGVIRLVSVAAASLSLESFHQTCGSTFGDTVEVDVRINGASQPIDAAGVDIPYPPQFEYVGYRRGDLTTAWPFFDAANVGNVVRVGGFTQTPIPGGSSGVFVTLRFVVDCCDGFADHWICPQALVDDFASMTSECGMWSCVALRALPSTWGYVKSLYR